MNIWELEMGKPMKIERIEEMSRLAVVAGTCHHRSLTDDTKNQVALNAYELDVFSIADSGGALCPPSQNLKTF